MERLPLGINLWNQHIHSSHLTLRSHPSDDLTRIEDFAVLPLISLQEETLVSLNSPQTLSTGFAGYEERLICSPLSQLSNETILSGIQLLPEILSWFIWPHLSPYKRFLSKHFSLSQSESSEDDKLRFKLTNQSTAAHDVMLRHASCTLLIGYSFATLHDSGLKSSTWSTEGSIRVDRFSANLNSIISWFVKLLYRAAVVSAVIPDGSCPLRQPKTSHPSILREVRWLRWAKIWHGDFVSGVSYYSYWGLFWDRTNNSINTLLDVENWVKILNTTRVSISPKPLYYQ